MGRGRNDTEALAHAFVTLRGASGKDPDAVAAAVEEATDELGAALERHPHYSKAEAAKLFGVTPPTLDAWIDQGLLLMAQVPEYRRDRVPAEPLLTLASEVRELQRLGHRRDLLAEAMLRLEQEDPEWRAEFDELFGRALARRARSDELVSAAPGDDWDPED
jgi:DNA-binding transcriptional MerR regulator